MATSKRSSKDSGPTEVRADDEALADAMDAEQAEPDPAAEPEGDTVAGNTLVTDQDREALEQARRNSHVPMTSEDFNQ